MNAPRVTKLMNVCQMDGGIGPVGQTLRRSDSVNRHLREIDRHKNVLNARFFHGQYPELARAASLPLVAKSHPFFVRQLSLGPRYWKNQPHHRRQGSQRQHCPPHSKRPFGPAFPCRN